jgi:FxsC-like protein
VLYFFVSYARGDDDPYVRRFFQDLSREVRVHAGVSSGQEVGFLDTQGLRLGDHWPERLGEALSTARSFVALCSPGYFRSVACRTEWAAFDNRVRRYRADTLILPEVMLPLRWFPVDPMPSPVAEIQWDTDGVRRRRLDDGIRQLLRLRRHRDTYLELLTELARRIVAQSVYELPALDRPLSSIVPAFASPAGPSEALVASPAARFVHFVVAAPSRAQAATIRESVEYYGSTPQEWAPYRPALEQALAERARLIATWRNFSSAVSTIEELRDRIVAARRDNHLVVLLLDPWCARLEDHRIFLEDYDRDREQGAAILIPVAGADRETQANVLPLSAEICQALRKSVDSHDDEMFHFAIPDAAKFDLLLERTLEAAQNHVFVHGTVHRLPPGGSKSSIHRFEGSY